MKMILQEFTTHNGSYPDVIEMTFEMIVRYRSLLLSPPHIKDLTFRGIPIRETS